MNKYQARFVESVLKKVISGVYRKIDAHRKLGYSRVYIDELIEKYKKDGYSSLIHKNTRRAPINKIDFNKSNQVVSFSQENLCHTRPRRSCFGELIQIDGSIHLWFGKGSNR